MRGEDGPQGPGFSEGTTRRQPTPPAPRPRQRLGCMTSKATGSTRERRKLDRWHTWQKWQAWRDQNDGNQRSSTSMGSFVLPTPITGRRSPPTQRGVCGRTSVESGHSGLGRPLSLPPRLPNNGTLPRHEDVMRTCPTDVTALSEGGKEALPDQMGNKTSSTSYASPTRAQPLDTARSRKAAKKPAYSNKFCDTFWPQPPRGKSGPRQSMSRRSEWTC